MKLAISLTDEFWFLQIVALICGIIYYGISSFKPPSESNAWKTIRYDIIQELVYTTMPCSY